MHSITGATFEPAGSGTGFANYFSVADAGGEVLHTDQFTVMGKEAGPVLASTGLVDFGGQNVNTGPTAPRTVNLTNVGAGPLTITALAATPAGRFNVQDPGTCIGRALLRDNGCNITVTFDPVDVGELAGSLIVTHDGIRSPFTIELAGTGTNPGQEAILSASPTSLSFGSVRIRTQSLAQRVRVTNTGTRPLVFSSVELTDVLVGNPGDKDQFVITSNVAARASQCSRRSVATSTSRCGPPATARSRPTSCSART